MCVGGCLRARLRGSFAGFSRRTAACSELVPICSALRPLSGAFLAQRDVRYMLASDIAGRGQWRGVQARLASEIARVARYGIRIRNTNTIRYEIRFPNGGIRWGNTVGNTVLQLRRHTPASPPWCQHAYATTSLVLDASHYRHQNWPRAKVATRTVGVERPPQSLYLIAGEWGRSTRRCSLLTQKALCIMTSHDLDAKHAVGVLPAV
jgi:hypothetical protein